MIHETINPSNQNPWRDEMRIAGYTYRADTFCPTCVIESMIAHGIAAPAARDMPAEDALWQCAEAMAIDSMDESSYDSGEFPKVVFALQIEFDERCGGCGRGLK